MNSPIDRFCSLWNHSVRRQLVLSVALVHALLMGIFVYDMVARQRDFLHRESLSHAESLAHTLAASSASGVLSGDLMGLAEITRSVSNTPGLAYVCILDPAGRVLSHTDPQLTGKYVADPVSLSLLEHAPVPQRLVVDQDQIDLAAPILSGSRLLGWARIGLSQVDQRKNLHRVTDDGLSYALITICVGAAMALFIASKLSTGLDSLVSAVDAVRAGNRNVRADEDRTDEIGRLGAGFNAMLQAVREGEEKFRTVADFTYDWEYWRGPDGRLIWMSPSCELFTGHTVEDFMRDPGLLRTLVHEEDRHLYDAHMHEVESGSIEPGELDFRLRHRNGQTVWIDHHCEDITRGDGKLLGRRVSNRDITGRKMAEEGLRRWAQAFENAAWGIVICTPRSGRIRAMNPAFARMHGYTQQELEGQPIDIIIPPHKRSNVQANLFLSHLTGHNTFEVEHVRKDGTRFPAQMDVTAVKDHREDVRYRVVNVQDITERRQSQDEILRAKNAAEAANTAKNNFLAIMSHELRTPLNGIKGMLLMLRDAKLSQPERETFLEHALTASDNLALVLNDLLDITRIEAGKVHIQEEPFHMEDVAKPVCEGLASAASEKGLAISYTIQPELPGLLLGAAGRIRQILLNLLGNAVKFTPSGQVNLEIYPLPGPAAMTAGGRIPVHFAITDTGIGIADEHLKHVFEPFTQVESPFTRSHGGVGLGLPIVKRLCALLGGRLDVFSEPDHGTEVHITLPLRRFQPQEQNAALFADEQFLEQVRNQYALEQPALKALVVDDDGPERDALLEHLSALGHQGVGVAGGNQALQALADNPFDLVLMVVRMQDMDGIEATHRIRTEKERFDPAIPIIAVASDSMQDDREFCLRAGMTDYLAKPFGPEELNSTLLRVLSSQSPVRTA